jgi:sugar/nucleoside kinase (ribokinase family)
VDVAGARLVHFGYPSLMSGMTADKAAPLVRLFARARRTGATTSLDLAVIDPASTAAELDWRSILGEVLTEIDIFTPSLDDLTTALGIDEPFSPELVERLAAWAIDLGVGVVAISAGEHGMFLRAAPAERLALGGPVLGNLPESWANARHWQPPFPVASVATTNGAGDALTAGLLYGMWFAQDVAGACRTSAACAGIRIMGRTLDRDSLHRALEGGRGDES